MDAILDNGWMIQGKKDCERKNCPSAEELLLYPMLDEGRFDEVDECLFRCEECKRRLRTIETKTGEA